MYPESKTSKAREAQGEIKIWRQKIQDGRQYYLSTCIFVACYTVTCNTSFCRFLSMASLSKALFLCMCASLKINCDFLLFYMKLFFPTSQTKGRIVRILDILRRFYVWNLHGQLNVPKPIIAVSNTQKSVSWNSSWIMASSHELDISSCDLCNKPINSDHMQITERGLDHIPQISAEFVHTCLVKKLHKPF